MHNTYSILPILLDSQCFFTGRVDKSCFQVVVWLGACLLWPMKLDLASAWESANRYGFCQQARWKASAARGGSEARHLLGDMTLYRRRIQKGSNLVAIEDMVASTFPSDYSTIGFHDELEFHLLVLTGQFLNHTSEGYFCNPVVAFTPMCFHAFGWIPTAGKWSRADEPKFLSISSFIIDC